MYRFGSRLPRPSFPTCLRASAPSLCFPAANLAWGGARGTWGRKEREEESADTETRRLVLEVTVTSSSPVQESNLEALGRDEEVGGEGASRPGRLRPKGSVGLLLDWAL